MRTDKPRIPPMKKSEWDPETEALFQRMGYNTDEEVYNIFKTLAYHPKLLKRWLPFANHILFKSTLSPRLREIAILRIGWLCNSEYEWTQHVRIGKIEAGMTDADFSALEVGSEDIHWAEIEKLVLCSVEELYYKQYIEDDTWSKLVKHLSQQQIIDLVATVGNYTLVSMMLNSFGVQLDDWLTTYTKFPKG